MIQQEQEQVQQVLKLQEGEQVPNHCIPLRADVTSLDWVKLGSVAQFDVITMDPPWQLVYNNT